MLQPLKIITIISIITLISACGGGGGSDSSPKDNSGGGTTTPTNTAPTITLSSSNIDLNENSSTTIDVTTSDAENDTVTITASSSDSAVITAYSNDVLTITASEINADTTVTITVTATDSKSASSSKTLTVNLKDLPKQAPELSWIGDAPTEQMSERTKLSIPFNVIDVDTDISELVFDVAFSLTDGYQKEENMPTFEIDRANKLLILTAKPSDDERSELQGIFSVSDGNTEKSIPLTIKLHARESLTNILFEDDFVIEGGSSVELPFEVVSNNSNQFVFGEISYLNNSDETDNLLSWSLDSTGKTIEVTASSGAIGKTIALQIAFTDKELYNSNNERLYSTAIFNVHIRDVITENEVNLMAKYELFKRNIEMSKEYEKVSEFLLDYLLISQQISQDKYDELYKDTYMVRSSIYVISDDFEYTIKNKLLTTSLYADDDQYQSMVDMLDNIMSQSETTWAREMVVFINENVLNLVGKISTSLPNIDPVDFYSLVDGEQVSRLVGKPEFGSYVNGKWVFNNTYSFLRASSAITLNNSNL